MGWKVSAYQLYLGKVFLEGFLHGLFMPLVIDKVYQRLFTVYVNQVRKVLLHRGQLSGGRKKSERVKKCNNKPVLPLP